MTGIVSPRGIRCLVALVAVLLSVGAALADESQIYINWNHHTFTSKTQMTYLVVGNPILNPSTSPVYKKMFQRASELEADYIRYIAWCPYPIVGLAQPKPPTGLFVCDQEPESSFLTLRCREGEGVFSTVEDAAYGTPSGYCTSLRHNRTCDSPDIAEIVRSRCIGREECTIPTDPLELGIADPCPKLNKKLSVRALCTNPKNHSNWDWSEVRPQLELFWNSTEGHIRIPNLSTVPTWMYETDDWNYPADPNQVMWDYPKGTQRKDSTKLIAEYYGRVLSFLTKGEFTDEYGEVHKNGYHWNITHWEVYNEPIGCHDLTIEEYVAQYDAIVTEVRRVADPDHKIQFVGLSLQTRNQSQIRYFLDASHHKASALPLNLFSFHFYAIALSRTNISTFPDYFDQADVFFTEMRDILRIRDEIAPHVVADVEEMGVILPDDNAPNQSDPPALYYNAASAVFAYTWANSIQYGLEIIGESQLAGVPAMPQYDISAPQYPSVSMTNWTTGEGNARYWTLRMLREHFHVGDKLVETEFSVPSGVYCQGFVTAGQQQKKLLVLNKTQFSQSVSLSHSESLSGSSVATIDLSTADGPARTESLTENRLVLAPFAVSIVTFSH